MTGLSGSGKSSIAYETKKLLKKEGINTYVLDGDNLRHTLNKDLGYSLKDREENIRRAACVASILREANVITIATFITPTNRLRELAKSIISDAYFRLIYVKASLQECIKRDPKGLYAKAQSGLIDEFTGISQIFEEPVSYDLLLDTEKNLLGECVGIFYKFIIKEIAQI